MTEVLDFDKIFNDYMAQNQKTWTHDRSQSVGASEVFGCIRSAFFSKRGKEFGYEPDEGSEDQSWGGLERGNIIENNFLVPGLTVGLPKHMKLLYAGTDQQSIVVDRASATPDGLITGLKRGKLVIRSRGKEITIDDIGANEIVIEFKSIDPRVTLAEEKAQHHGQTVMQLGLIRETTKYKPNYAIILYVNASFVDHITPFVVKFDEGIYRQGLQRAESVWLHDDPMKFLPEGVFDDACKYCKFTKACGQATAAAIPGVAKIDPLDITLLDTVVDEYLEAQYAAKEAARSFEVAKERIKETLTEVGTKKVKTDGYSLSWYAQPGRKVVDTKAMAADGIDLAPYTREGASFDVLRVTLKKDEEVE